MDTKSKNYRYSVWFKLLAVVLCVAGMIVLAYGLLQAPYFNDAVQNKEFKESTGKDIFLNAYHNISEVAFHYKSEENIKSGAELDNEDLKNRKVYLEAEKKSQLEQIENKYYQSLNQYQIYINDQKFIIENGKVSENSNIVNDLKIKDIQEKVNQLKEDKDKEIRETAESYDKLISNVEEEQINSQLNEYKNYFDSLNNSSGIYYTVIQNGKTTLSNVPSTNSEDSFFSALPFSAKLTQSNFVSYFSSKYFPYYVIPAESVVYLGMSEDRYNAEVLNFEKHVSKGEIGIFTSFAGLLSFLLGLIYIIYSSGRRTTKEGIHLIAVDIIYLDIALVVSVAAIALGIAAIIEFLSNYFPNNLRFNQTIVYSIFSVIIAVGTLIGLLFVSMFMKRVKRKEVVKHTFLYKVIKWLTTKLRIISQKIRSNISGVFDKSPLAIRLVLLFGGYSLLILILSVIFIIEEALVCLIGILVVNGIALYYLLKNFKTFINICDGAEKIRAGELTYNVPVQGMTELKVLAVTINKIADGLKTAVSSQVKAERMKAELITNVSHDLKTPLTSIITYVDLLKNEGLHSENSNKYLDIIDAKSQRLKSLTEDLFEAAKATSGNISINFERINVASLISQGLGELSDKIETSGLTFKTNIPADNVYVSADGKLLWRVIENLLSNVFKYALPNSRVYMDVICENSKVKIVVKNISAYELNVSEDELMERFKRGDESRHSEGSGLGLSIAKSLTQLQKGSFSISIDGDLFKATIELPQLS